MKLIKNTLLAGLMLSTAAFAVDNPGGKNITAFDRVGERKIGGYFDTEFISSEDGQTFKAHRMILQASSQVHERILFNTEIEFEYGGDDGNGGEIKLEQAWADFELVDDHFLRSGIVIVPVGRLNIYHDSDYRDATNRPIYAKYIVPTTWMDTGFGGHGTFDVADWELHYEAYVINGLNESVTSNATKSGLRSARPSFKEDNNTASAFAGRLGISPFNGLDIGTSVYTGKYSDNNEDGLTLTSIDGFWKKGSFELVGEAGQVHLQGSAVPDKMTGFYVEARHHFFPAFLTTSFERPTFTAFARYGEVDLDTSTTDNYDRKQTTIGINYRPIESAVIKLEVELNEAEKGDVANQINASVALGF